MTQRDTEDSARDLCASFTEERDWRLLGFSKSACPPADTNVYSTGLRMEYRECAEWRERTLGRIVNEEDPDLVVTSMLNRYRARRATRRSWTASPPP